MERCAMVIAWKNQCFCDVNSQTHLLTQLHHSQNHNRNFLLPLTGWFWNLFGMAKETNSQNNFEKEHSLKNQTDLGDYYKLQ